MSPSNRAGLTGFLIATFMVVGLTGLFAVYAIPVPLERAMQREALLDAALLASQAPDGASRLAAMRDSLGDMADAVLTGPGDITERIAKARSGMVAQLELEAQTIALRVRWMMIVVTLCAGGFGAALLGLASNGTRQR